MDSRQIKRELEAVLRRYQAGLISLPQARQQQSLLRDMLKAHEITEIEEKRQRLEAVLEARR